MDCASVEGSAEVGGQSGDGLWPGRRDHALLALRTKAHQRRERKESAMSRPVLRYTFAERTVHWLAALTYGYVLLTGLAFYTPHLYWIATLLGGAPTSRFWHPWIGVLFIVSVLWMLQTWIADMRITDTDRSWGRKMVLYIRNEDEALPPADR